MLFSGGRKENKQRDRVRPSLPEDVLAKLCAMGLTKYEATLYAYLIVSPASLQELTQIPHVPRTRVYDVVKRLQNQKIISPLPGKPGFYSAVAVPQLVRLLIAEKEQEYIRKSELFETFGKEILDEIEAHLPSSEPESFESAPTGIASLDNHFSVLNELKDLFENEGSELRIVADLDRCPLTPARGGLLQLAGLAARKVRLQIVCHITRENLKLAETVNRYAEIRHTLDDFSNEEFFLFSDRAIHTKQTSGGYASGYIVFDDGLKKGCAARFNDLWANSLTFKQRVDELNHYVKQPNEREIRNGRF